VSTDPYERREQLAQLCARRLRDGRVRAGMTERELARFSGISERQIRRLEKGKTLPRLNTIKILCLALGYTVLGFISD
jgi:transcriptional regulator with XRE-family HTH domain